MSIACGAIYFFFFFFALRLTDSSLFSSSSMQHWNSPSMGEPLLRRGPGLDGRQKIKSSRRSLRSLALYSPKKDRYVGSPIWTFPYFSFSCKKLFWGKKKAKLCFSPFFCLSGCVYIIRDRNGTSTTATSEPLGL